MDTLIHKIVLRRMKKTAFSSLPDIYGRNHYDINRPSRKQPVILVRISSSSVCCANTPGQNSTKSLIMWASMEDQWTPRGVYRGKVKMVCRSTPQRGKRFTNSSRSSG